MLMQFVKCQLNSDDSPCTMIFLQIVKVTPDNPTCSENMAYDNIGNIPKMSSQANVTCSDNIAYATVSNVREDITNSTTSHTVVYDEVQPTKS